MNFVILTLALLLAVAVLLLLRSLMTKSEQRRSAWDQFFLPLRLAGKLLSSALAKVFNSKAGLVSSVKVLEILLPCPVAVLILSASGIRIPDTSPISIGWAAAWLCAFIIGIVFCKRRLRALKRKEAEALIAELMAKNVPEELER